MRKHAWLLSGIATLLLGADGVDTSLEDLPACGPNTYLVYRSGKIICEPALPDCGGQLLHAGPGGGLTALSCTPKFDDALSAAERQRVQDLQGQLKGLVEQLDALGVPPRLTASFVGNTTATTIGRIAVPGQPVGLASANAMCEAELGMGAHMCSVREMVGAVINGTLTQAKDVPKAWLYMPTWNNPSPGAQEPLSGLGDNCGGYTEGTTARGWTGMAADWSNTYNARSLHWNSGSLAPCHQPLPIACCK